MIETILFQLFMPFLINPADPDSKEAYTSGLGDVKNSYITDKPPTDYPMITFDVGTYDSEFNFLEPGFYAVDLALESKKILIIRAGKIVAKCPIIQLVQLEEEVAVPSAQIAFIKDKKVFVIYKNGNIEAHGFLYKSDGEPGD